VRRTTVFLPDTLHEELRQEAFQKKISMAQLILCRLQNESAPGPAGSAPLLEVSGIFSDGTLTRNIDEELYDL